MRAKVLSCSVKRLSSPDGLFAFTLSDRSHALYVVQKFLIFCRNAVSEQSGLFFDRL